MNLFPLRFWPSFPFFKYCRIIKSNLPGFVSYEGRYCLKKIPKFSLVIRAGVLIYHFLISPAPSVCIHEAPPSYYLPFSFLWLFSGRRLLDLEFTKKWRGWIDVKILESLRAEFNFNKVFAGRARLLWEFLQVEQAYFQNADKMGQ